MASLERVLIRFDRHSVSYAKDEIAGFPKERAALYVKNNIGHYCDAQGNASKNPVVVKVEPPSVKALAAVAMAQKIDLLKGLSALRDQKAITVEEFETEKAKLLAA